MEGVLVDPGGEAEKLMTEAKGLGVKVTEIWLTHGHLDHAGGAEDIRAELGIPVIGPHKDDQFWLDQIEASWAKYGQAGMGKDIVPDRYLEDGDVLKIGETEFGVVHTPGHTSNHLCFALEESGALFTGDHVMAWSTSVIVPPDGNMSDYMVSLQKIYERDDKVYYPAHGKKVTKPRQLVRGMMGHRKQRERQIIKLLEEAPHAIVDMVPKMYKGLDPRLTGAAGQSVRAHLIDLQDRNEVALDGEIWSMNG